MAIPPAQLADFLADLKQHLNMTTTKHDAELLDKLEAAFELAEAVVGRTLYPASATEIVRLLPLLKYHPVTAVTSVTYRGADHSGTVEVSEAGVITGAYTGTSITYTYGQSEPTPAQREGVLLVAAHLWETQRAVVTGPLGGQVDDEGATFAPGYGFAVPNRARDLLRPPAAVSGIA